MRAIHAHMLEVSYSGFVTDLFIYEFGSYEPNIKKSTPKNDMIKIHMSSLLNLSPKMQYDIIAVVIGAKFITIATKTNGRYLRA